MADYTGFNNVVREINNYAFSKISVKKGRSILFSCEGEKPELLAKFKQWADNFLQPGVNDYTTLTVEIGFKKKSEGESISFTFSFKPLPTSGMGNEVKPVSDNILIDYGRLQSENATLHARILILENENADLQNEILQYEEESEGLGNEPEFSPGIMGQVEQAVIPVLPQLVSALIDRLKPIPRPHAMAGVSYSVNECVEQLQELDPAFSTNINKLLTLRVNNPDAYNMAVSMIDNFIKK